MSLIILIVVYALIAGLAILALGFMAAKVADLCGDRRYQFGIEPIIICGAFWPVAVPGYIAYLAVYWLRYKK